jgi:hypothetical protein
LPCGRGNEKPSAHSSFPTKDWSSGWRRNYGIEISNYPSILEREEIRNEIQKIVDQVNLKPFIISNKSKIFKSDRRTFQPRKRPFDPDPKIEKKEHFSRNIAQKSGPFSALRRN